MRHFLLILFFTGLCRLAAAQAADAIYTGGVIWTGVPEAPWAEAIAVRDGLIEAIGTADEVGHLRGPQTRVVVLCKALCGAGLHR